MTMFREHVQRAVELAGSQTVLAGRLGRSQQFISWLLHSAKRVTAETALAIEGATDGAVTASQLRPDLPWTNSHEARQSGHDFDRGGSQ